MANETFHTSRVDSAGGSHQFDAMHEVVRVAARAAARRGLRGAPGLVDDVVAETVARAYARWERLSVHENLAGWATRCARLVCLEMLRAHGREVTNGERLPEAAGWTASGWEEEHAVRDELAHALAGLTDRQRQVLTLRYTHNLDEVTTAARLGLSVANVRAAAHEGRARMRKLLAETEQRADRSEGCAA